LKINSTALRSFDRTNGNMILEADRPRATKKAA